MTDDVTRKHSRSSLELLNVLQAQADQVLMNPALVDLCEDPLIAPGRREGIPCGDCDGCLAWAGSEEANPCAPF